MTEPKRPFPPEETDPDYWMYEEDDDLSDEHDAALEAFERCSIIVEGERYWCLAAGSEDCDFECPLNNLIGKKVGDLDEEPT